MSVLWLHWQTSYFQMSLHSPISVKGKQCIFLEDTIQPMATEPPGTQHPLPPLGSPESHAILHDCSICVSVEVRSARFSGSLCLTCPSPLSLAHIHGQEKVCTILQDPSPAHDTHSGWTFPLLLTMKAIPDKQSNLDNSWGCPR